jgi:membrane peptidoglycan carboxypeptidase
MYLPKIAQLLVLIVVAGVVGAGFLIPYVGGTGLLAVKATDKFNNTVCPLNVTDIDPPQQTTTLYASDGTTKIASFFNEDRVAIPFAQMPTKLIQALVDTEDRRFYSHHGVDVKGLVRAALHTSNGDTQGASTLTEQYVKQVNYYNAISKGDTAAANAAIVQTAERKISDAKCALEVEDHYTKDEILEKYLNIAFFGESAYGIQEAAETYFDVPASKLTVAQGALLVGLVQAPTSYDPYNYPQDAQTRRNVVLANMVTQHDLTPAEEAVDAASPIGPLARQSEPPRGCAYSNPAIVNVGFFCDYAEQWLTSTGGLTADEINTGGLKIVSTLQVSLQNRGQAALVDMGTKTLSASSPYLLAMPSIQPKTGGVTSMITDKKYGTVPATDPNYTSYTVNPIFTSAYAGSGSTYKYFTTIAALEAGVSPNFTLYAPSPYTMHNCTDPTNQAYHPENAGDDGSVLPLSTALPKSSNTYFVGMEDQLFGCNLAPIVNTATSLGMNYLLGKGSSGNTIAQEIIDGKSTTFTLGEEPTSALDLTGAYATLANGGVYCPPTPIASITDVNGKAVPFKKAPCTRQYSPYVANTLVNIMTHDTTSLYGTASQYFGSWYGNGGSLIAGKTGTDNATSCDANGDNCVDNGSNSGLWFMGVTPNLTAVAALVNPDNPNKEISGVPGITPGENNGTDTFGAYASQYWQAAYGPTLAQQHWTWTQASQTPGNQVPVVTGLDPATATTQLTTAGFKVNVLGDNETCGSKVPVGNVAYYSPAIAEPGDVVNLCLSSGVPPAAIPAPKPKTPVPPATATPVPGTTAAPAAPVAPAPTAAPAATP